MCEMKKKAGKLWIQDTQNGENWIMQLWHFHW